MPLLQKDSMVEAIMRKRQVLAEKRYSKSLRSGLIWYLKAEELKLASDILYRSRRRAIKRFIPTLDQEMFMLGLAFELLLKAFHYSQHRSKNLSAKMLKSHDLLELRRIVNPSNTDHEEMRILLNLTKVIVWQGRYPVALKPIYNTPVTFTPKDVQIARALWCRYKRQAPDGIFHEIHSVLKRLKNN